MAQNRTDNFNIAAPKSIDNRYLKNGVTVYASPTEAHTLTLYKHIGLTCLIVENGEPVEYWYASSIATVNDLVRKIPYTTMTTSELRSSTGLSTSSLVTTTDLGGGTWSYLGIDDNIYEDNSGTIIITADAKVWKRIYSGNVSATWFGLSTNNSKTSNTSALQLAINSVSLTGGGIIDIPSGEFSLNKIVLKNKVILNGQGNSHSSIYFIGTANKLGTLLFIDGQSGEDCLSFDINTSFSGLHNLSIYNSNANTINSVVNISGVLYPTLLNVEISSKFHAPTGHKSYGLLMKGNSTTGILGRFDTLYGHISNVKVITNENVGVSIALGLIGTGIAERPNAIQFVGGHFQGYSLSLLVDGTLPNSAPQGIAFLGTTFESYFNNEQELIFVPNSVGMQAFNDVDRYAVVWMKLAQANQVTFVGCYFEDGGVPFDGIDDGVNGNHICFPMIYVTSQASQVNLSLGNTLIAGVYDQGHNTTHPNKISFIDYNNVCYIKGEAIGSVSTSQVTLGTSDTTGLRVRGGRVLVGALSNSDTGEDIQIPGVAKIGEIKNIYTQNDIVAVKVGGSKLKLENEINEVAIASEPIGSTVDMVLSVEGNEVARLKANEFVVQEVFTAASRGSFVGTVSGADAALGQDFVTLNQLDSISSYSYTNELFTI